eukprot:SM000095S24949  [mRNA]  locus=s95:17170:17523:- [translate_table: standard]
MEKDRRRGRHGRHCGAQAVTSVATGRALDCGPRRCSPTPASAALAQAMEGPATDGNMSVTPFDREPPSSTSSPLVRQPSQT